MNKVILIGRLTKDPEIRSTQTGKKVASFSIAIDDGKDQNGQKQTQFFNCSAWDKTAEVLEMYAPKGSRIAVVGQLKNRSWDKPDGSKAYSTDVVVRELELLSSKSENEGLRQSPTNTTQHNHNHELPEVNVDDINIQMPF